MSKLIIYLESKEVVFHSALALIVLYVPHAGHLFKQIEHIDMTVFGFTVLNWIYGIALASVIELLILVFIINGYQRAGKAYALVSFFINALYYDYWFIALQNPSILNIKLTATSFLICFMHSLAIWQLSDLFFKRIKADKEKVIEHWCRNVERDRFRTSGHWMGISVKGIVTSGRILEYQIPRGKGKFSEARFYSFVWKGQLL